MTRSNTRRGNPIAVAIVIVMFALCCVIVSIFQSVAADLSTISANRNKGIISLAAPGKETASDRSL